MLAIEILYISRFGKPQKIVFVNTFLVYQELVPDKPKLVRVSKHHRAGCWAKTCSIKSSFIKHGIQIATSVIISENTSVYISFIFCKLVFLTLLSKGIS